MLALSSLRFACPAAVTVLRDCWPSAARAAGALRARLPATPAPTAAFLSPPSTRPRSAVQQENDAIEPDTERIEAIDEQIAALEMERENRKTANYKRDWLEGPLPSAPRLAHPA